MVYAYVRVSTKEQNEDRQVIAMREYGVKPENVFVDKQSGKDFERAGYKKLMQRLKKGDVLIIKSIDRLGRNYSEILQQWQEITKKKKADIKVLDMELLDTTKQKDLMGTLISDIVLQLLSYVAENERINIRQRQAEGIAAARARGVRFGRPPVFKLEDVLSVRERFKRKEITQKEAVAILGCSSKTYYKLLHRMEKGNI
ncbi:MAG: recombinase family protein [Firmicutes bacterium]|nr:recombinase family protein [Bacillota bacterium]